MEKLEKLTTEELVKELEIRNVELSVDKVLYDQLIQLRSLSQKEANKNEPELVVSISLAMVEIAKSYLL